MSRKYVKKLIESRELADFFGMEIIDVNRNIAKGKRLDFVYIVLNRDDLTTKEKRAYIYRTSMSEQMKNNIWERFCGDYWFDYCKTVSTSIEFEIIQEGGTV